MQIHAQYGLEKYWIVLTLRLIKAFKRLINAGLSLYCFYIRMTLSWSLLFLLDQQDLEQAKGGLCMKPNPTS